MHASHDDVSQWTKASLEFSNKEHFHWLLYQGWPVAFSCLLRVILENSSYRPPLLGTLGLCPAALGRERVLVKEIYSKQGLQAGWTLMERWIHRDWLEIPACEAGRAQGSCPLVMVMLRCSVCRGWLWGQLECGGTATGAVNASCSHGLPWVQNAHQRAFRL